MSDHFGNIPIKQPESPPPDVAKKTRKTKQIKKTPRVRSSIKIKEKKPSSPLRSVILGIVLLLLIFFASYCAIGFWGVPYYVTKVLPQQFNEQTGMVLQPTTISFNPFTFHLETGELNIRAKKGQPVLTLNSLSSDISPARLLQKKAVCRSLTIGGLSLNITRQQDGSYDFLQLPAKNEQKRGQPLSDLAKLPFSYSLNNISVSGASLRLTDIPAGKVHILEKIQLDLPTLANIPLEVEQYLQPHFSAVVNGSPIELSGQSEDDSAATGRDRSTKLSLDIKGLNLTLYAGYLPFNLPLEIQKGQADGKIDLFFDPQSKKLDKFSLGFQLDIVNAELSRPKHQLSLSLPTTQLKGRLLPTSKKLQISELTFKNSKLRFIDDSTLTNILKNEEQSGTSTRTPYQLRIDQVFMDNGKMAVFAKKNDTQAAISWEKLQLTIKGYTSGPVSNTESSQSAFSFSGEQQGSESYFSWQGKIPTKNIFTGDFRLRKIEGEKLLKAIGSNHPFSISGLADLDGQLTLSSPENGSINFAYKLKNATISIDDFALYTTKGKNPTLKAPRVKFSPVSYQNQLAHLGTIQLEKGQALFTYGRIPQLFSSFDNKKYSLEEISYQGSVQFSSEKQSDISLNFRELTLTASELSNPKNSTKNLTISGKTTKGATIKSQGKVNLVPFGVELQTEFDKLAIGEVLPFFSNSPDVLNVSGYLSGKGDLQLPAKNFRGKLQLSSVSSRKNKTRLFSWREGIFQEFNYEHSPFLLTSKAVQIEEANLRWKITSKSKEPMQCFSEFSHTYLQGTQKDSKTAKSPGLRSGINLQQVSFSKSSIDIYDQRLQPTWQSKISNLSGKIRNLDSTGVNRRSDFSFSGSLDGSSFTIDGHTSPFSRNKQGTFHFSLDSYPLASFYQQLSGQTDIDLSKGVVKLKLDCNWRDNSFMSRGYLDLDHLTPLEPTSDLALPLALLTDPEGNIRQSFDFSRKSPVGSTSLIDELFRSFRTKLIKGSVSPLLLARGDFTDLIDNESIEFQPGEFMLSNSGRATLSRYVALLISHPNIGLVLSGGVNRQIDSQAMEQHLQSLEQQRVEQLNEKLFKAWEEKKALYEEELLYKEKVLDLDGNIIEQDIPPEILAGFIPVQPQTIIIDEEMLIDLAQRRIDIIYQHFNTQLVLEPERVSISRDAPMIQKSAEAINGVRISLKSIQNSPPTKSGISH